MATYYPGGSSRDKNTKRATSSVIAKYQNDGKKATTAAKKTNSYRGTAVLPVKSSKKSTEIFRFRGVKSALF